MQLRLAAALAPRSDRLLRRRGVLDNGSSQNPFADWDVVHAAYCDGSIFTGDVDREIDGNRYVTPGSGHTFVLGLGFAMTNRHTDESGADVNGYEWLDTLVNDPGSLSNVVELD